MVQPLWKIGTFFKLSIQLLHDPTASLLAMKSENKIKKHVHGHLYQNVIGGLFILAKIGEKPSQQENGYTSVGYTVYPYNGIPLSKKEEKTTDAQMNLRNIMLRETSQNKRVHTV